MENVKLRLEAAISNVTTSESGKEAGKHLALAAKHATTGVRDWAKENPKIATALAAGATGIALGKRLSRRG